MNIIDAIKSDRWFKRASEPNKSYLFTNLESEVMEFTREQLLADDWEIEQTSVTITREQFYAAWRKAVREPYEYPTSMVDVIARELGL